MLIKNSLQLEKNKKKQKIATFSQNKLTSWPRKPLKEHFKGYRTVITN